jgi:ubiquinone/menaquinone biosynthesis C-methylase UbiE
MKNIGDKIFGREDRVCPWWLCFTFDNPLRGIFQNPYSILDGYIKPGDTVLDIGPGMGYFTLPMSKMTGEKGKVVALDIQEGMLRRLGKKIQKNNSLNIETKLYDGDSFSLNYTFDFILLFWMYHEVGNKNVFIREIKSVIKKNSLLLIAEPKIHVNKKMFSASVKLFTDQGFTIFKEPEISLSHSVILKL